MRPLLAARLTCLALVAFCPPSNADTFYYLGFRSGVEKRRYGKSLVNPLAGPVGESAATGCA